MSRKLHQQLGDKVSVVNAGIAGNMVVSSLATPSAVDRVNRDVIQLAGASHVIWMQGINELYAASGPIALNFGSLATDSTRQQINTYILTSGLFDGTIDFAAAVTDPLTGMLRVPYVPNSQGSAGDYLHPNRAGYQAMELAATNLMLSMLAN